MNSLLGIWIYTSLIFQGQPYPRPDDRLQMFFIFSNETENQLLYYRKGEPGQCKRTAQYDFSNNKLYQKVVETDSANAFGCSEDPDMILGQESVSELAVEENCMYLTLPLGDDTLTYVWQKADTNGENCEKRK